MRRQLARIIDVGNITGGLSLGELFAQSPAGWRSSRRGLVEFTGVVYDGPRC